MNTYRIEFTAPLKPCGKWPDDWLAQTTTVQAASLKQARQYAVRRVAEQDGRLLDVYPENKNGLRR